MYNESEIEFALRYRDYEALAKRYQADEAELLAKVRYSYYTDKVTTSGNKCYRGEFLEALQGHGIYYDEPFKNDDRKWHFYLPKIKEDVYEEG